MSVDPRSLILVDDEAHVRRSLKYLLFDEKYDLITAGSGSEALELLEKQEVAMIISDYRMPGMSGVELLSILKEKYPDMIGIVLTGIGDSEAAVEAVNNGAIYKLMNKPWDNTELLVAIKRALEYRDLCIAHRELMQRVGQQDQILKKLETRNPELIPPQPHDRKISTARVD